MNLYKLELMKIHLSVYLWAILGIFVGLSALGVLFLFIFQMELGKSGIPEEGELFANWSGLLALMTALAFCCFSVLASIIAAKVIISEYCGKNAVVLLSYPVKRKTILAAKCQLLCGMTTVFAFLSNVLALGVMYVAAHIFRIVLQMDKEHFILTVLCSGVLMGVLSSSVGIISSVFGLKKRSSMAAIVCGLMIVCVMANMITVSPRNITVVMLTISAFLGMIAYLMYHILINKIEQMEV